jgi:hypothetical protein
MQRPGLDCGVAYSPTAMISSIRIVSGIVVKGGRPVFELDVKKAYCHGVMDKTSYIQLPPGTKLPDTDDAPSSC